MNKIWMALACIGAMFAISLSALAEPLTLPIRDDVAKTVQWQGANAESGTLKFENTFPDVTWWKQFQDPVLENLIQNALSHNQTIAIAEARLAQARATARQTLAKELPTMTIGASASQSENIYSNRGSTSSSSTTSASTGGGQFFAANVVSTVYSLPLRVNYEPDIWFAKRDSTLAKRQLVKTEQEHLRAAQLSVMTDVAAYYFTLLGQNNQLILAEKSVAASKADLNNTQTQLDVGLISEDAVNLKTQQLARLESQYAYAQQVKSEALHALATLEGTTIENLALPDLSKPLESIPIQTTFQTGLPSELLERRPDILASEAALEATRYDVRIARKAFLPLFNLAGQFGYTDISISNTFSLQNLAWNAVAGLTQSLFSGGALKANLRFNQAKQKEAAHQYQQTILKVCEEVDNSLTALKAAYTSYEKTQETISAVEKQNAIIKARIEVGTLAENAAATQDLANYEAKSTQIQSHLNVLIQSLSLYKALGGGY